ncbi:hypothetical protein [Cohnella sp. JJ-181]|uniref:hypothetical protein n=1 Tax=Cohnella rhizoplanae TaxID=2974897 RepID=UPI0022FF50AC|nr:hypothetical protein [Cohnella sp. JJ-181]CAI6063456.1 hypothetical protein COHCIP112018_01979 [Cohnella sp. JJ-181]
MKTEILQQVTIVDMDEEIIARVDFSHAADLAGSLAIGWSVVTYPLGLREFEVVYDRREARKVSSKVVDIEIDTTSETRTVRAYLEPVKLILGQHDVGAAE